MLLYRVQTEQGVGYLAAPKMWCFRNTHLNDGTERFQHPDCDNVLCEHVLKMFDQKNVWKFAFERKVHLLLWFRLTELERLAAQGFDVYEIQVDEKDVVCGTRQAIFIADKIERTRKMNLDDFYKEFKQNESYLRSMHTEGGYSSYEDSDDSDE